MNKTKQESIEIDTFLIEVRKKTKEGIVYVDAMQLSALHTSGELPSLVTLAIDKYQEATYEITELSKQKNVDECALASMGMLWHGEHFEGSTEFIESSQEEIILDSLYFILKYAKSENPLEEALAANKSVCGDMEARKLLIELAFGM